MTLVVYVYAHVSSFGVVGIFWNERNTAAAWMASVCHLAFYLTALTCHPSFGCCIQMRLVEVTGMSRSIVSSASIVCPCCSWVLLAFGEEKEKMTWKWYLFGAEQTVYSIMSWRQMNWRKKIWSSKISFSLVWSDFWHPFLRPLSSSSLRCSVLREQRKIALPAGWIWIEFTIPLCMLIIVVVDFERYIWSFVLFKILL